MFDCQGGLIRPGERVSGSNEQRDAERSETQASIRKLSLLPRRYSNVLISATWVPGYRHFPNIIERNLPTTVRYHQMMCSKIPAGCVKSATGILVG